MPNRCVAAGCLNVPDPSKIGLHKFLKTMIPRGKDADFGSHLGGRNVRNGLPQMHHAYVHNIYKPIYYNV